MIHEAATIARPGNLGGLGKVALQCTSLRRYSQNIDVARMGPVGPAAPDRDETAVRRKTECANRRVDQLGYSALRQIAVLSSPDLGDPCVGVAVLFRQKGNETAIARDSGGLLRSGQVRQLGHPRIAQRIAVSNIALSHDPIADQRNGNER